jgi:hypothetical protein
MYKFLAPLLSQQLIRAPTLRPHVIRDLFPTAPPRPKKTKIKPKHTLYLGYLFSFLIQIQKQKETW